MEGYTGKYRLNLVNGLPMNINIPENRLQVLADFPLRTDDVFIVTYPKSGTTWTQQIVKLIKNNGVDDGVQLPSTIPWLELPKNDPIVKDLPSPRAFKSHTNYELMPGGEPAKSPAKYIYVARNPKDTAVSLYYHTRGFKDFEFTGNWDVFFEYFISGKAEGGSWFDHVLEWWKHKDCPNILYLKYEDMHADLSGNVKKIADFLGIHLEDSIVKKIVDLTTFDVMKMNPSANYSWREADGRTAGSEPFMRKGIVGDWRNHFTQKQSERFDSMYEKIMANTGLDFTF